MGDETEEFDLSVLLADVHSEHFMLSAAFFFIVGAVKCLLVTSISCSLAMVVNLLCPLLKALDFGKVIFLKCFPRF